MKKHTKYTIGFTSIVLAGTLGLGTMAFAGDEDGTGGRRPRFTDAQKCEHQDEVADKAAAAQERIADRVARLTERRAAAEAAGHTVQVARIDRHLTRLAKLSDRIDTRLAKFQTWAAEHCPAV
jgi:cytochrome c biogenesis factor